MIYTIKRPLEEFEHDGIVQLDTDKIYLNIKNIVSIEKYREEEIYGYIINGLKYPLFNLTDFVDAEISRLYTKDKAKYRRFELIREKKEDETAEWEEFINDTWDKVFVWFENTFDEIVALMKAGEE